jgi:hypothetical protein
MSEPRFTWHDGHKSHKPPRRYRNLPMDRDEAREVASGWELQTGIPVELIPSGEGYDARLPMEVVRAWLAGLSGG